MTGGRLPFIDALLSESAPDHLFHYTDGAGFLGILDSKELWAGRAADLNDSKEQEYAFDLARLLIDNWLEVQPPTDERLRDLLDLARGGIYETNRQVYTVSLSAERDVLSQWRAYCPRSGGIALGLPAEHLKRAAGDQGFYLARCIYDWGAQQQLVGEIVRSHVNDFERQLTAETSLGELEMTAVARRIGADLAQYGPLLKHASFSEEREWRLVSAPSQVADERLHFRPSEAGLRVYLRFRLHTTSAPTMRRSEAFEGPGAVIGPSIDSGSQQVAVQNALHKELGYSCWHSATSSPYR